MGKLCQSCNQREAKIHFTELKDGKKTEMHLCEHCAQEKNMVTAFPSLLSTLVGPAAQKSESDAVPATCPGCGLAYAEFKAKGRLGCPECYSVFAPVLVPLLEKVHGHTRHKGRRPKHLPPPETPEADSVVEESREPGRKSDEPSTEPEPSATETEHDEKLRRLRAELTAAVLEEQYELAAELRDKIRALEEKEDDAE
jgi:protein arginine kinase activator